MLWLQTMRSKYGVEPDAVTYGEVMRIYAETYVSINYFYFVVVGIDILSLTDIDYFFWHVVTHLLRSHSFSELFVVQCNNIIDM